MAVKVKTDDPTRNAAACNMRISRLPLLPRGLVPLPLALPLDLVPLRRPPLYRQPFRHRRRRHHSLRLQLGRTISNLRRRRGVTLLLQDNTPRRTERVPAPAAVAAIIGGPSAQRPILRVASITALNTTTTSSSRRRRRRRRPPPIRSSSSGTAPVLITSRSRFRHEEEEGVIIRAFTTTSSSSSSTSSSRSRSTSTTTSSSSEWQQLR